MAKEKGTLNRSVETGWYLRLAGGGGCTDRWNCVCILMRGLC